MIWLLFALAAQVPDREPWTTSRVTGTPDPPAPYHEEPAFPKLKFQSPTDLAGIPGSRLLAVAEQGGKVYSFAAASEAPELRIDLGRTLYGIAFHPRFAKNGYLYAISADPAEGMMRLSRVTLGPSTPDSELVLLRWPCGALGHGGGALRFGPDGFLYAGIGDGSAAMDSLETGQDLGDLPASIVRIDVDRPSSSFPYGIPSDNPFVGRAGARPEIWAYGIRQPWKISFDRSGGELWAGSVGQDLWESVLRVRRGGNYGWSVLEGTHPFRPDRRKGSDPILPPAAEHPHSEFRALIGGLVYRGSRLAELAGTYVYGDYETGRIWGLSTEAGSRPRELAATRLRIVSFGEDADGELYILDYLRGTLHRLAPGAAGRHNPAFPRKLSETGLFAALRELRPAPGVVPYTVTAPLWSDQAIKERHLALPGTSRIGFGDIPNHPLVEAPRGWGFPDGTVLVKTFSLELEPGNPASRRRIETRLLHLEKMADTQDLREHYWRGYSYAWNDGQTDAELVDAGGRDLGVDIREGGGTRRQVWRFPSRAECMVCHSTPAQFVLGVTTLQMNRDIEAAGGGTINQLTHLERLGLFRTPLPGPPRDLAHLVDPADERQDLDARARSYLHANCAQCHIRLGGGNSAFQLQATLPLERTGLIDAAPVHGSHGAADARLLVPGHPERSMLYVRMGLAHEGRMPPLSSSVVDEQGRRLVARWIEDLSPDRPDWMLRLAVGSVAALLVLFAVLRRRRARA